MMLKAIAAQLPLRAQQALKRHLHGYRIRSRTFSGGEPEFERLAEWVRPGDWAIDLGANIGHYTYRLSELAGAAGRVIAFEPMPQTFELLSANVARFRHDNVTLVNAAASDHTGIVNMALPRFESGLDNFYMAQITEQAADIRALALTVDSLNIEHRVALVKIDVEGHEIHAVNGMRELIARSLPVLIIEGSDDTIDDRLQHLGYSSLTLDGSPNRIFLPQKQNLN